MMEDRLFLERREQIEVHRRHGGDVDRSCTDERGMALGREDGPSRHHRWRLLPPGSSLSALPELLREPVERMFGAAPLAGTALEDFFEGLAGLERSHPGAWVQVRMREYRQQVVCFGGERLAADERSHALVEMRAFVERAGRTAFVQADHAFGSGGALAAGLAEVLTGVPALWRRAESRLATVPVESGPTTVVLPPGADAGVLFHEVCGHALEGDVVARGASYLASRLGQRVAGEHVTVLDDPCRGPGTVTYSMDDEGNPARPVPLIREGVVTEPLLDRQSAAALERAVNGHGRRVSFRHPPLPRMAHTELAPHRGRLADITAGVQRGLLVRHLTPRHVNLMTGDFSFYLIEGQTIVDGELGGFIGPALLNGNGLAVLQGVHTVGEDLSSFFALKGCGKLEHGELPVSYGNPTVRIEGLHVSSWI